jgi:hypothetical protein
MGWRGARGDKGICPPTLGEMGIELNDCLKALGMGEFMGLSPGRGLMGNPGLKTVRETG